MRSNFYYQGHHEQVAAAIKDYLNSKEGFLSPETAHSPRAVGDALESLVTDKFEDFLGNWCKTIRMNSHAVPWPIWHSPM